jgi:hypothetical protein
MTWFDLVLKISAILGGALAILTFWRTAKVRRAEWLSNLHAKFFEGASYIRKQDFEGLEALLKDSVEGKKW